MLHEQPDEETLAGVRGLLPPGEKLTNLEITIQASSGGVEAQDWARLLLRMYTRWLRSHGYSHTLQELECGPRGTVRRATVDVTGSAGEAYELLRREEGVHRLTRVSPFDSAGRRQTSFAVVELLPVRKTKEFELNMADVRVDTFRSSGKGGQNVNKRSTGVRATHLPTGLTAQRQSRSQHQNRQEAVRVLAARVAKHDDNTPAPAGGKTTAWGEQVRSYSFVPHALVKDHRTGYKTSRLQRILDGDVNELIWHSYEDNE